MSDGLAEVIREAQVFMRHFREHTVTGCNACAASPADPDWPAEAATEHDHSQCACTACFLSPYYEGHRLPKGHMYKPPSTCGYVWKPAPPTATREAEERPAYFDVLHRYQRLHAALREIVGMCDIDAEHTGRKECRVAEHDIARAALSKENNRG